MPGHARLGLLRAMPSLGALIVSLLMTVRPIKHNAGRLMLTCVGIFGAATVVFGLSHTMWISLLALLIVGASDMVSVVVRSSILQLATPPEMRGRVSAVNWLFIGASNEFGEFESGRHRALVGRRPRRRGRRNRLLARYRCASVLFPALRRADALTADALMAANVQQSVAEPAD